MPSARAGKTLTKISWKAKKATLTIGDEKIVLSENAFTEFHLYEGKEVSNQELKKIKDYAALDDLYGYSLRLLSARNYTSHEIREKLYSKNKDIETVRKIIFRLKKNGLLDDASYAKAYLEDAYDVKCIGEKRIRFELEKKGIGAEVMATLPFSENKELEGAKKYARLLEKRYVKVPNAAKRGKIVSALLSRGYSQEIAMEATSELSYNDEVTEVSQLEKEYNKAKARYSRKYEGYELRQKVIAYLLQKGFRYDDIKEIEE